MAGSKSWQERKKKGGGGRERNLKILDNREVSLFLIVQLRGNENSNIKLTKKYDLYYFIPGTEFLT